MDFLLTFLLLNKSCNLSLFVLHVFMSFKITLCSVHQSDGDTESGSQRGAGERGGEGQEVGWRS